MFIYAFEYTESNSAIIIQLLNKNEIEAVVSARVLAEVVNYFKTYYNKENLKRNLKRLPKETEY